MSFIHYRTQGLVLSKEEKGEKDQVFNLFTEEFGYLEILGKGIRKITSKLRPNMELFSFSEIEFIQGKIHKTLTDAILIEKFKNIKKDFQRLETIFKIAEIINFFSNQEEKDKKVWDLLIKTFQELDKPNLSIDQVSLIFLFFFWNFISLMGYKPELYLCSQCQKKLLPETLWFNPQQGEILCWRCLKNFSQEELKLEEIKVETIKFLRILVEGNWKFLNHFQIEKDVLQNLEKISSSYYTFFNKEIRK